MPKIIKNVEEIIENTAIDLFSHLEYEAVDMKMIAKKSNIAVGTLYNYYPNKKQLFLHVFSKSWEITLNDLDKIYHSSLSKEDKLLTSINLLYDGVQYRRGMGRYICKIISKNHEQDEDMLCFVHGLFEKIERLFIILDKKGTLGEDKYINSRLTKTLLQMIQTSISSHPNCKEENISYIKQIIINSIV